MAIIENTQFGKVGAFKYWCQKVLPAVYDDSLSYYELLCKVTHKLEEIIETTNVQSDAINELQTLMQSFIDGELTSYIEETIDAWFEENEPEIMQDLEDMDEKINTFNETLDEKIDNTATALGERIDTLDYNVDLRLDAIEANDWVTTDRIADGSVTKEKLAKGKLVVFGDSWASIDPNHEDWMHPLADLLNCELEDYAVGATSFAYNPSQSIGTQIQIAVANMTQEEKEAVTYVVLMGGVNDHQPTPPANYDTAVDGCISTLASNFPNALIQFFTTSCAPTYGFATKWTECIRSHWRIQMKYAMTSETSWPNGSRICFNTCGAAFWFNSIAPIQTYFKADGLHPNGYGRNAIINCLLEGFGLGNINPNITYSYTYNDRPISINMTPHSFDFAGSIAANNTDNVLNFGRAMSERIEAALCGMYPNDHIILKYVTEGSGTAGHYVRLYKNSLFDPNNVYGLMVEDIRNNPIVYF